MGDRGKRVQGNRTAKNVRITGFVLAAVIPVFGTFEAPSATTGVQASLTSGKYYSAGDRARAHLGRDGHVTLANGGRAAVMMALWILVACGVAYVEVVGVRMLDRRLRGAPQIRLWPVSPGQVAQLFVIGAGIWALAVLPLVAAWHND